MITQDIFYSLTKVVTELTKICFAVVCNNIARQQIVFEISLLYSFALFLVFFKQVEEDG